jgi:molybdopterin-binding protein
MDEQHRQILQMLAEGKITTDEAERLIEALDREPAESPSAVATRPKRPKYLRVVVLENSGDGGPGRVNVRVPLQLLRAGVRLTSLIPPRALARINLELGKSGIELDLAQLKPQDIEDLIEQLVEIDVDIEDAGSKVQVFCE